MLPECFSRWILSPIGGIVCLSIVIADRSSCLAYGISLRLNTKVRRPAALIQSDRGSIEGDKNGTGPASVSITSFHIEVPKTI